MFGSEDSSKHPNYSHFSLLELEVHHTQTLRNGLFIITVPRIIWWSDRRKHMGKSSASCHRPYSQGDRITAPCESQTLYDSWLCATLQGMYVRNHFATSQLNINYNDNSSKKLEGHWTILKGKTTYLKIHLPALALNRFQANVTVRSHLACFTSKLS